MRVGLQFGGGGIEVETKEGREREGTRGKRSKRVVESARR